MELHGLDQIVLSGMWILVKAKCDIGVAGNTVVTSVLVAFDSLVAQAFQPVLLFLDEPPTR